MNVKELIQELQKYPEDLEVRIFDWKKNMHDDCGDGSFEGIYHIEIEHHNIEGEEKEYFEERNERKYNPWLALTFDNEDLEG